MSDKTPIILTGPPGCGKSHWIQKYAGRLQKQLFVCPCRKDRTLRDGRQKLHVWARRTEPAILWLEGADDLTPEAQAFLRRILETHASDVLFILECRDAGRLQEPIRSRCIIKKMYQPSRDELQTYIQNTFNGLDANSIINYLSRNEYSYRRVQQLGFLQMNYPKIWGNLVNHNKNESDICKELNGDNLIKYIKGAYNPDRLIYEYLNNEKILKEYGKCGEISGSLWAFLGSALYNDATTPQNE
jgi:hypothetical protein